MKRKRRPFFVCKEEGDWILTPQFPPFRTIDGFKTAGEAIDYAYKNWPWWP